MSKLRKVLGRVLSASVVLSSAVTYPPAQVSAAPATPADSNQCRSTSPITYEQQWSTSPDPFGGATPFPQDPTVNFTSLSDMTSYLTWQTLGGNLRASVSWETLPDAGDPVLSGPFSGQPSTPEDFAPAGVPGSFAVTVESPAGSGAWQTVAYYTLSDCDLIPVDSTFTAINGPVAYESIVGGTLGAPSTTEDRTASPLLAGFRCPAGTESIDWSWEVVQRTNPAFTMDPGESGTATLPLPVVESFNPSPSWASGTRVAYSSWNDLNYIVIRPGAAGLINASVTCRDAGGADLRTITHNSPTVTPTEVWISTHEPGNTHSLRVVNLDGTPHSMEVGDPYYIEASCDHGAHYMNLNVSGAGASMNLTRTFTGSWYGWNAFGPINREPDFVPVYHTVNIMGGGSFYELLEPFPMVFGPFTATTADTVYMNIVCSDHIQGIGVGRFNQSEDFDAPAAYDLALVKVVNDADGVVAPGDTVTWTVRVTNQGDVDSGVFDVTDTLPTGLQFVSADNGGTEAAGVVTWSNLPNLAPGTSVDLTVTTTVPVDAVDGASFRNWAEISADSGDDEDSTPDTTTGSDNTPSDPYTDIDDLADSVLDNFDATDEDDNDDAEITVSVDAPAVYDLALVKVVNDADGVVTAGDNVTWTIRVTNQGNVDSGPFGVTDTMPTGTGFVSASNGGTHAAGVVTWTDLPSIAPGASVDLTLTLSTDAAAVNGTVLRNWAEISADSGDDEDSTPDTTTGSDQTPSDPYTDIDSLDDSTLDNFDATDEDDNDDAEVTLAADPPVDVYDLALVKIVNDADGIVAPGDNVSWTIRVTNQGDVASGLFSVTDVLPVGLTFVSASNGGTHAGGVVTFADLPSLAAGASVDLTVTTMVPAATADGSSFRNWAEISSDSGDDEDSQPNTDVTDDEYTDIDNLADSVLDNFDATDEDDNDDAEITVSVDAPAAYDLALIKTADRSTVSDGDEVSWTITVKNQGDVDSGLYSVTDTLPTGMGFVSASDGGTHSNGVVTWTDLPNIAPGETATLTLVTEVNDMSAAPFRNWAEISEDSGDDEDSTPDTDTGSDNTDPNDEVDNHNDVDTDEPVGDEDDNDFEEVDGDPTPDPVYDLALVKVVNDTDGIVAPGSTVTWTIRVQNQGNVDSGLFNVTDTLPSGMGFVSASDGGTHSNGVVTWTDLPSIAPGAFVDLTVTTDVPIIAASGTVYRNWAEISSDSGDDEDSTPDTTTGSDNTPSDPYTDIDDLVDAADDNFDATDEDDNDDAQVTLSFDAPARYDLGLAKIVNDADGRVAIGENVQWTIRVHNQGEVDSGPITVTDTLPAGVQFVSAGQSGSHTAGVVTWAVANVPVGGSVDLIVVTQVTTTGSHRNWAEISADSGDDIDSVPDGDPSNDNYEGTDDLNDPNRGEDDHDDAVIVSDDRELPEAGGDLTMLAFASILIGLGYICTRVNRKTVRV